MRNGLYFEVEKKKNWRVKNFGHARTMIRLLKSLIHFFLNITLMDITDKLYIKNPYESWWAWGMVYILKIEKKKLHVKNCGSLRYAHIWKNLAWNFTGKNTFFFFEKWRGCPMISNYRKSYIENWLFWPVNALWTFFIFFILVRKNKYLRLVVDWWFAAPPSKVR